LASGFAAADEDAFEEPTEAAEEVDADFATADAVSGAVRCAPEAAVAACAPPGNTNVTAKATAIPPATIR
jgi:hypothetical protein